MLRKLLKKMLTFGFVENYHNDEMIIYPPAKINIGLYVTGKRLDGYHNISSLFYPLQLCDILEFIPFADKAISSDRLKTSGLEIPGKSSENLIIKALGEIRKFNQLPFFDIHLHKKIPMGAGLGGGSSDAASFLKAVRSFSKPALSESMLQKIALSLGSDCPFFLDPCSSLASGRGEELEAFNVSLKGYLICVFNPGIHVSTRKAYQKVEIGSPATPLKEALKQPVEEWKESVHNVFEEAIFEMHPEIEELKVHLYASGAVYASMTGSGSSVYGIFREIRDWTNFMAETHIWTEYL